MRTKAFEILSQLLIDHHFLPDMAVKRKRSGHHEVYTLSKDLPTFKKQATRHRFSAVQFRNQRHELVVLMQDPKHRNQIAVEFPTCTERHSAKAHAAAMRDPTLAHLPTRDTLKQRLASVDFNEPLAA